MFSQICASKLLIHLSGWFVFDYKQYIHPNSFILKRKTLMCTLDNIYI